MIYNSGGCDFSQPPLILFDENFRNDDTVAGRRNNFYLNGVGGFHLDEPAGDLPAAMALYSGIMDKPVREDIIAFGEIGLGGEIRSVSHISQRIREAERMGFSTCIVPEHSMSALDVRDYDIEIIPVLSLKQAFSHIK